MNFADYLSGNFGIAKDRLPRIFDTSEEMKAILKAMKPSLDPNAFDISKEMRAAMSGVKPLFDSITRTQNIMEQFCKQTNTFNKVCGNYELPNYLVSKLMTSSASNKDYSYLLGYVGNNHLSHPTQTTVTINDSDDYSEETLDLTIEILEQTVEALKAKRNGK